MNSRTVFSSAAAIASLLIASLGISSAGGTFGTTAPCNGRPCPKGPARLVLRKPVRLTPAFGDKQGKRILVYRRSTLCHPNWNGRRLVANISDRTGWGACRRSCR